MNDRCEKCRKKATWFARWLSDDDSELHGQFCEKHVPRGCSCNINEEDGIEHLDFFGRQWPCCDYSWEPHYFWTWLERKTLWVPWRNRKIRKSSSYVDLNDGEETEP